MSEEPKKVKIESHCRNLGGMLHEPPEKCTGCGANMRPKEFDGKGAGPHINIQLPVPGISLYQCTKCHTIMGNVHAIANLLRQQEMERQARSIILPFAKPEEKKIITLQ